MSTIRRERRPLDITYHIDTPGVPVSTRYINEIIERADDGTETIIKSEITTDSQADAATVAQHLGDSLASGRTEEQRALAAEQAAHAECARHEAEIERLREAMKDQANRIREQDAQLQRAGEALAAAQAEITRLRAPQEDPESDPIPQELPRA